MAIVGVIDKCGKRLTATIGGGRTLVGAMNINGNRVRPPEYTGEYIVTPLVVGQTLDTKGKLMADDVRIKEIPYFDVGNTTGGSTVYIGSLEDVTI